MTEINPLHRFAFVLWACFIVAFWGLMGSRAFAPEIFDAIPFVHEPLGGSWLVWGIIATMAVSAIGESWSLPTIVLMSLSVFAGMAAGLVWQIA